MTAPKNPYPTETLPIRWVCGSCCRVLLTPLKAKYGYKSGHGNYRMEIKELIFPICCQGQPMLLAGEPKVDVHGLVRKGILIDPVHNLAPPQRIAA